MEATRQGLWHPPQENQLPAKLADFELKALLFASNLGGYLTLSLQENNLQLLQYKSRQKWNFYVH